MIFDNASIFSLVLSTPDYDPFNNEENLANQENVLHKLDPIIDTSYEEFKGSINFKVTRTTNGFSEVTG